MCVSLTDPDFMATVHIINFYWDQVACGCCSQDDPLDQLSSVLLECVNTGPCFHLISGASTNQREHRNEAPLICNHGNQMRLISEDSCHKLIELLMCSSQEREVVRCTAAVRDQLKKALATSETKVECIHT